MHTVVWFRKGLRLHDNPALLEALDGGSRVMPVFVLDPHFLKPQHVGTNRMNFLLQSLADLDASLRARSSRLIVLHGATVLEAVCAATGTHAPPAGKPEEVLPQVLRAWDVKRLCFEWCVGGAGLECALHAADKRPASTRDWEPYAQSRDAAVTAAARDLGCDVRTPVSHTIYDPRAVICANKGTPPLTYTVQADCAAHSGPHRPHSLH